MRVGIIGAGISGISCAYELQRNNVDYTLYEQNSFIGDEFTHISAFINMFDVEIGNLIEYLKKEYDININILNTMDRVVHHGPNTDMVVEKENMGQFLIRSSNKESLPNQLFSHLINPKVKYNKYVEIEELLPKYDYVVLANGNNLMSQKHFAWNNWTQTCLKGVMTKGNFDKNELQVWFNKEYCNDGYVYLCPQNNELAAIVMVATNIISDQIEEYWDKFIKGENIKLDIEEEFVIEHVAGYVKPYSDGKVICVGNAMGGIEPFLGFGQLNAIFSGFNAAKSIITKEKYEDLIKPIIDRNLNMLEFRKKYEKLDNDGIDRMLKTLANPVVNNLVYHTNLDIPKLGGGIFKMIPNEVKFKD